MHRTIPRLVALSPGAGRRAPLVVAAVRAGALGVLDASLGDTWPESLDEAHAVARLLRGRTFGVRVGSGDPERLALLPDSARVVWVECGPDGGRDHALLARLRQSGRAVLAEVRTRDEAWAAAEAGYDGLVIAGHEAGGRGGEESSFILLQAVLARPVPAVWVRGGVGPHVAAACVAMGARGVVLEGALLLTRESPLDHAARARIRHWDGSETAVFGRATDTPLRLYAAPGSAVLDTLKSAESEWETATARHVGWGA